ncbi:MAG: NAD-dependent epimerase/dehydratase family protein [Myxococcota bacterium]
MPTPTIETSAPVLVTGATGYVAGRLVERLLTDGLTVHATVRDPSKTERLAYLNDLADASPGSIVFFAADLTQEGSFAEAMQGCSVVFHVASPFISGAADPQKTLVEPAVGGTRNVLEQANATPSVKRVVLTSSCAAIYGDNSDAKDLPGGVFTEEIWNTSSSLTHNAYSYSKTLAEREGWKIHDSQSAWSLVTINPCLVMGPGVRIHSTSESFSLMKQMGDGSFKSGAPDLGVGVVDVRDVAEAHFQAAFRESASGRYITAGHNTSLPKMADALRARFSAYPLPKRTLPKFVVWLFGPMLNSTLTRTYVSRNIGWPWKGDNSKSIRELGMTYRPLEDTLGEFFQQLVDAGELKAP